MSGIQQLLSPAISAAVCFVVLAQVSARSSSVDTYSLSNGIHCKKCPPGFRVVDDCIADFTNSTCTPCPKHHFSNVSNGKKHCQPCRSSCPKYGTEIQNCTTTTNLVCGCQPGYHRFPFDDIDTHYKFDCKIHRNCRKGSGEVFYGNFTHDTHCEECHDGTEFVNDTDPNHPKCQKCSVCSQGIVLRPCSLSSDTECFGNNTHSENSTESPPPGNSSENIDGGALAGIIIGVLAFVVIVLAIAICFNKRIRKFVLHFIQRICRQQQATPGRQEETKARKSLLRDGQTDANGKSRHETEANGSLPDGQTEANGRSLPEGQTVANGSLFPDRQWTVEFIAKDVFSFLSKNLGSEWQQFILQLPGWQVTPVNQAQTVIDYKRDEERRVPDQIYGCLTEWRQQYPEHVTQENIVQTLEEIDKRELIEALEQLQSSIDFNNFRSNGQ